MSKYCRSRPLFPYYSVSALPIPMIQYGDGRSLLRASDIQLQKEEEKQIDLKARRR
jgi:hypothetical protein